MALTRRVDGTQTQNLVNAAWWNDFYDLLTGTTTDQPVTIANSLTTTRQGSTSVRTDLLQLKTTTSAAHEYHLYVGTAGEYGIWDVTNNLKVFSATTTGLTLGTGPQLAYYSGTHATQLWTPQTGVAQWLEFVTWNGSASKVPFGVGSASSGNALAWVDDVGNITSTGGTVFSNVFAGRTSGDMWVTPQQTGAAGAAHLQGWDGAAAHDGIVVQSSGIAYIGTSRNGSLVTVPVFTGTTSPVSPPTGSYWIKA